MTLFGCPVWRTDNGGYYLGMPSNKSAKGEHYKSCELAQGPFKAATTAVLRAISSQEGNADGAEAPYEGATKPF